MEVPLNPDTESRIRRLAAGSDRDPEQFAADLLERFVEQDDRFREAVERGVEQADQGDLIEESEMDARVGAWFAS